MTLTEVWNDCPLCFKPMVAEIKQAVLVNDDGEDEEMPGLLDFNISCLEGHYSIYGASENEGAFLISGEEVRINNFQIIRGAGLTSVASFEEPFLHFQIDKPIDFDSFSNELKILELIKKYDDVYNIIKEEEL